MTTLLAIIGGILLGVVSNEVFDVMPWMAVRVLRVAARLDARFDGEAELLLAEWEEQLEQLPGKLTKFAFAIGMLFRVAMARRIDLVRSVVRDGLPAQWMVQNIQIVATTVATVVVSLAGVLVNFVGVFSLHLNEFVNSVWSMLVATMAAIISFLFRGRERVALGRNSRAP